MGMLKNIFAGSKKGSCCDIKIEEAAPKPSSGCCGSKKEGSADLNKGDSKF